MPSSFAMCMEQTGLAVGGVDLVFDLRVSNCALVYVTDRGSERFSLGVSNILNSCQDFLKLQAYTNVKKCDVHKCSAATLGSSRNPPSVYDVQQIFSLVCYTCISICICTECIYRVISNGNEE